MSEHYDDNQHRYEMAKTKKLGDLLNVLMESLGGDSDDHMGYDENEDKLESYDEDYDMDSPRKNVGPVEGDDLTSDGGPADADEEFNESLKKRWGISGKKQTGR